MTIGIIRFRQWLTQHHTWQASRTSAYKGLAQELSRLVSAFSSFTREYLDSLIKADRCAQYLDKFGIAGRTASEFIENLEAVVQKIRAAGLKLSMGKSQFGVQEIEFLGHTITPKETSPINTKVEKFLDGLRLPSKHNVVLDLLTSTRNFFQNCPTSYYHFISFWRMTRLSLQQRIMR